MIGSYLLNKKINRALISTSVIASSLLLGASFASIAHAEQIRVPIGSQGTMNSELPKRGLNSKQLLGDFGEPNHVSGPVGQPPISQWHYASFVVYLEGDYVIHSVQKPKLKTNN
ncbi:hypothetical protein [uncultured Pseudoteredinibacter sp.]|uniref:hypothetical protein n=1 Tax=uncultured Pseudoteredinibacter sp. TaxID=1641701 RepID=UPI002614E285|nr:hypothetical protein [uncultured Pseudoteredinibacter sp.]